jgi:hypothetical protein
MLIYSPKWYHQTLLHMQIITRFVTHFSIVTERLSYYCNSIGNNNNNNKNTTLSCLNDPKKWIKQEDKITEHNFEFSVCDNYANCISYTLYLIDTFSAKHAMYLKCIKLSLDRIKKELPNVLVRIYFYMAPNFIIDEKHQNDINLIKEYTNVEFYEIFIDPVFASAPIIHSIRAFRLLPMCDNTINACLMKDIDSLITSVECFNYNKFIASQHVMYIINTHYSIKYSFESPWSTFVYFYPLYDVYRHMPTEEKIKKFFLTKTEDNYYPNDIILLGLFGTKLHFSTSILQKACDLLYLIDLQNYFPYSKTVFLDEFIANNIYSPLFMYPSINRKCNSQSTCIINDGYGINCKCLEHYHNACGVTATEINRTMSPEIETLFINKGVIEMRLIEISLMWHADNHSSINSLINNDGSNNGGFIRFVEYKLSQEFFNLIKKYRTDILYNDMDTAILYNIGAYVDKTQISDWDEL